MADWDENGPSDDDIVSQFPQNERAARAAVKTNFGVDHREENDANVGKHEIIQMLAQTAPAALAGQGFLYTKDVGGGVIELFYLDPDDNEVQITNDGGVLVVLAGLEDGILTADTAGRAKMADSYITTAKLLDGLLAADTTGRAKMADNFITNAKVNNSELGSEKFQTGSEETDWVLARYADAAYGAVGTYVFGRIRIGAALGAGATIAGSSVFPAVLLAGTTSAALDGAYEDAQAGGFSPALSGTWRVMGHGSTAAFSTDRFTLFLRIS